MFVEGDVIPICGTDEQVAALREQLSRKKKKKRKREDEDPADVEFAEGIQLGTAEAVMVGPLEAMSSSIMVPPYEETTDVQVLAVEVSCALIVCFL